MRKLIEANQDCLATRVSDEQAEALSRVFPAGGAGPRGPDVLAARQAAAAAASARWWSSRPAPAICRWPAKPWSPPRSLGCGTHLLVDVGVAGIHRLLRHQHEFTGADVIIVAAGMDGALPSVVGGLVDCPVIAVPTSVGYGTAFAGLAPLLTMLNSCSANVVVVNIDNGFKAGYVAALLVRKIAQKSSQEITG